MIDIIITTDTIDNLKRLLRPGIEYRARVTNYRKFSRREQDYYRVNNRNLALHIGESEDWLHENRKKILGYVTRRMVLGKEEEIPFSETDLTAAEHNRLVEQLESDMIFAGVLVQNGQ